MKRGLGLALGLWLSVAANAAPIYGICEHVAIPGFEHENCGRTFDMMKAAGVAAYFPYEFRASERDPFYSENHFGLVHRDFTPKPAWKAYAEAIQGGN